LRFGAPCASSVSSPATGLSGYRFIASRRAAAFALSPKRDRSLVTAFPSPAMISACADSVTGSKVPACHFAHSLASLSARSAFRLRRQPLVCPSFRLHPRLKPVAFFTGLLCRLRRLPPLPFRSFRSLRIKASTGFATVRSTFRNCPIFVRSPQPFLLKFGCGS
jgi:hypothetical protein